MKKYILLIPFLIVTLFVNGQYWPENSLSDFSDEPKDIKAADLDNDGDFDVIIASNGDDRIVWHENLGNGEFSRLKHITYNIKNIRAVNFSDIDGDGNIDILSASGDDNKVAWYKNLGNGVIDTTQIIISTSVRYANSIFSIDINGDGYLDIFSTSQYDDKVIWFENLGNGVIDTNQHIISNSVDGASSIDTIDVNNDGDIDIVIGSYNMIVWFENLGNGIIDTNQHIISSSIGYAMSIHSTDIDGDLDLDLVSNSRSDNKVVWFENLGNGIIDTNQNVITSNAIGVVSVYPSDLNNDGDIDIISASQNDNKIAWYENLGSGIFGPQQVIATSSFPSSVYAKDLNNDGDIDILSTFVNGDISNWHENAGGGIFGTSHQFNYLITIANNALTADLDNDGDLDIIVDGNALLWYENMGGGLFATTPNIISADTTYSSVNTVDFDYDGNIDIISYAYPGLGIKWYKNLGNGIFSLIYTLPTTSLIDSDVGDIDNDGDIDIVIATGPNFSSLLWYENLGANSFIGHNLTTLRGANSVRITNIDNNNDLDIVATFYSGTPSVNQVAWYKNLGSSNFSTQNIISINTEFPYSIFSIDTDSDGDLDIISGSLKDTKLVLFENLGGSIDTTQHIISDHLGLNRVYVSSSDINNDGNTDIIASYDPYIAPFISGIYWYENLGNGIFDLTQQTITNNSSLFNNAVDIDNDGDIDVLSVSGNQNKITWYGNHLYFPKLKGRVYYDINQNGINDSTDIGLHFINTHLQPTTLAGYSSVNGDYTFTPDTGSFTLSYNPFLHWGLVSDSSSYTINLSINNLTKDSLDFGFYPDTILTVINLDLTGGFPRCNDTINYWASIHNQGTTLPNGVYHLQLDDSISYVSAAFPPDSINGQHLYWHYDSLFFFSQEMINLQVLMPPFTSMGDTLTSYLTVTEIDSLGNIVYSNSDTLEQVLVCAYDPNDKSVTPEGIGVDGFIAQNQELEYLIRFQNTGNDTAITVMIRDQLDGNLDLSTLRPIASSKPVQVWIEQGGEAVFKFENIMLPDSGADFLGSQGFVKFSIMPKTGLAPLTPIYNTGHIYFDNNPAVITNMVLNTIECFSAPEPFISYNFPYLDAGVTGNYSYQWYLNDTLIVGATADTLNPLVDGNYTVEIIDSNTCSNVSTTFPYAAVGIQELSQLNSVVYPNPFRESTTILFDKNLTGDYDLLIYNVVGAEVKRINKINGNRVEIYQREIGKGLFLTYLLNTKTGERIFIEKLIVQ